LGASLAGGRAQVWAAGLLIVLAIAYDSLLSPGLLLPATVPIALTLGVIGLRSALVHGATDRHLDAPAPGGADG
jgi:hypothetical protein